LLYNYRFHDIITRQKVICEAGSQQLLLDTYNLKTLLLHLHTIHTDGKPVGASIASPGGKAHQPPAVYSKFVLSKAAQIETILKLVGTPSDMIIERFRIMWPEGRLDDLTSVMTLKGLKKAEQQTLLDSQAGVLAALSAKPAPAASSSNSSSGGGGNIPAQSQVSPSHSASGAPGSSTTAAAASSYFSLDAATQLSVTSSASAVASSVSSLTQNLTTNMTSLGNIKWGGRTT
jgi:hypothetical protein